MIVAFLGIRVWKPSEFSRMSESAAETIDAADRISKRIKIRNVFIIHPRFPESCFEFVIGIGPLILLKINDL